MFLASKLIICLIDSFTLKMNSQSIAYLLSGSAHIHWTLNLEDEVHSIWVSWACGLQECKDNFFRVGWDVQNISIKIKKSWFFFGRLPGDRSPRPRPLFTSVWKCVGVSFTSTMFKGASFFGVIPWNLMKLQ